MVDFQVYMTKNVQKYLDSLSEAIRDRIFEILMPEKSINKNNY
jgi:hypothetical protein